MTNSLTFLSLLLMSLVQGLSLVTMRLTIHWSAGQVGMYSAGPEEPQLEIRHNITPRTQNSADILIVPEQPHHLEVDLVPVPPHPVDQQPSVVSLQVQILCNI